MGAEGKLGARKLARYATLVGADDVVMGFATHSPWVELITAADRHVFLNTRTGEHGEVDPAKIVHWTTCPSLASGEVS